MKAWEVIDEESYESYEPYVAVVFAETRSQAKVKALRTDALEGADYTSLRARRAPFFDEAYRGKDELDWYNSADRVWFCKGGYYCNDDAFDPADCASCPGKDFCDRYDCNDDAFDPADCASCPGKDFCDRYEEYLDEEEFDDEKEDQ